MIDSRYVPHLHPTDFIRDHICGLRLNSQAASACGRIARYLAKEYGESFNPMATQMSGRIQ